MSSENPVIRFGRPLLYLAIFVGAGWYYLNHREKARARKEYNHAVNLMNEGKHEKAIKELLAIRKQKLEDAELNEKVDEHLGKAFGKLAQQTFRKKEYKEAADTFKDMIKVAPDIAKKERAYYHLAECYRHMEGGSESKKVQIAIKYMEKAVEQDGGDKAAARRLAAYRNRRTALGLMDDAEDAYDDGKYEEAAEHYRKLAENEDYWQAAPEALPFYNLARCAAQRGSGAEACTWLAASEKHQGNRKGLDVKHQNLRRRLKEHFPEAYEAIAPKE